MKEYLLESGISYSTYTYWRRKLMKLLHAEDGGMVMYVKRLEAGRFKLPAYDPQTSIYRMEWCDLVVMVEGIHENPDFRLKHGQHHTPAGRSAIRGDSIDASSSHI